MIHHDQGTDWNDASYYFDRLLPRLQANGTDIDVIGYSYYPIYRPEELLSPAKPQQHGSCLREAGGRRRDRIPFRNPTQSKQNLGFPVTEAGQQAYLQAVVDAVKNVPQGMEQGVFWWYAEARPLPSGLSVWQNGQLHGLFTRMAI